MIQFYKGTPKITGSAGQLWYSTSERAIFLELLKQIGWNPNKGPNGSAFFKDPETGKSDPKKRNFVKLKVEEITEILDVISNNRVTNQLNDRSVAKNATITAYNNRIAEINAGLKEKGEAPIIPVVPEVITPFSKFNAYHKSKHQSSQVFFEPFVEKDKSFKGRYLISVLKKSLEDTTDSGKVQISLLLVPSEVRALEEYLTTAVRDIYLYRPNEKDPVLEKVEALDAKINRLFTAVENSKEEVLERVLNGGLTNAEATDVAEAEFAQHGPAGAPADPGAEAAADAQEFYDAQRQEGEQNMREAAAAHEAESQNRVNNQPQEGSQSSGDLNQMDLKPEDSKNPDDIPF